MAVTEPILTVAEVRRLEEDLAHSGTSLLDLMRRAGQAITGAVHEHASATHPVVILAGTGNNGGDGWVVADNLAAANQPVHLVSNRRPEDLQAEPARSAAKETMSHNHASLTLTFHPDENQLAALLAEATVVVDAILGTGFDGVRVREPYAGWIDALNQARANRDAASLREPSS